MTEHLRRAAPRQPAGWTAMYRLENVVAEPWRMCRVLDISPMGAGLELYQVVPDELLANGVITLAVELRGEGRNALRSDDGNAARFGIEFPEPSDAARQYMKEMDGSSY